MNPLLILLAALDDYEQTCSDRYERSGDPHYLAELRETSNLYNHYDAMRVR